MADILDTKIRLTGQNVSCPQIAFGFRLVDSETQTVEHEDRRDSRGRAFLFPDILQNLSQRRRLTLLRHIQDWFIEEALERERQRQD